MNEFTTIVCDPSNCLQATMLRHGCGLRSWHMVSRSILPSLFTECLAVRGQIASAWCFRTVKTVHWWWRHGVGIASLI